MLYLYIIQKPLSRRIQMGKVNYKSELFDILKDLTSINNSVVFEKEEDRIIVRRSDTEYNCLSTFCTKGVF